MVRGLPRVVCDATIVAYVRGFGPPAPQKAAHPRSLRRKVTPTRSRTIRVCRPGPGRAGTCTASSTKSWKARAAEPRGPRWRTETERLERPSWSPGNRCCNRRPGWLIVEISDAILTPCRNAHTPRYTLTLETSCALRARSSSLGIQCAVRCLGLGYEF